MATPTSPFVNAEARTVNALEAMAKALAHISGNLEILTANVIEIRKVLERTR